ncbi:MAG: dTDP-4-dehydrorhamnose 3,5-epimerase family protein [Longimicrobiales bacterium]
MIIRPTPLAGAYVITPERREDQRGFFARVWCEHELAAQGLNTRVAQCSISYNQRRGTLRGMHFQVAPAAEIKLVRCIRGTIHDVIIDLRPDSHTYLQHYAVQLSGENRLALYVPEGFAHGFQTLVDDTEVYYQMNVIFAAEHARGVRWNDPAFGLSWPIPNPIILERDDHYADFAEQVLA